MQLQVQLRHIEQQEKVNFDTAIDNQQFDLDIARVRIDLFSNLNKQAHRA
jgi:hypothetical protein